MKNHDDQNTRGPGGGEVLEPWVEPAMEVRIVALALGEASEFEKAELEEAMEQEPELKAFFDRIRGADAGFRDVLGAGALEEADEWRMSEERRDVVLARFRGDDRESQGADSVDSTALGGQTPAVNGWGAWRGYLGSIAAALVALLAVGGLFAPRWGGIKTRMMPAAGSVSERYYKNEERNWFLFDMVDADSEAVPQFAAPTAMPSSETAPTRGIRERRFATPSDRWGEDEGGANASIESLESNLMTFAPDPAEPEKVRRLAAVDVDRAAVPGGEIAGGSDDYGVVVDSKSRTDAESAYGAVPRMAVVRPPEGAPAAPEVEAEAAGAAYALADAKQDERGGAAPGASVFYEDGTDGLKRNEERFRSGARTSREPLPGAGDRYAEEIANDFVSNASGAIDGGFAGGGIVAGGAGAAIAGSEPEVELHEEFKAIDGWGSGDVARPRVVAKPQAAASGPQITGSAAQIVDSISGVEKERLDVLAPIVPDQSVLSTDDAMPADESAAAVTGGTVVAEAQVQQGQGQVAGQREADFADIAEGEARSNALYSGFGRDYLQEEKVRSRFKAITKGKAAIEGNTAALGSESELAIPETAPELPTPPTPESVPEIANGGAPIRAYVTDAEQAETKPDNDGDKIAAAREGDEAWGLGELEGKETYLWLDDRRKGQNRDGGRPIEVAKSPANKSAESFNQGLGNGDQFFGSLVEESTAPAVAEADLAKTVTVTRGEAEQTRLTVAPEETAESIGLLNFSRSINGFGVAGKKTEALAKLSDTPAERPESAVRAIELARNAPTESDRNGVADFDVEVDGETWERKLGRQLETGLEEIEEEIVAEQPTTRSLYSVTVEPESAEISRKVAADHFLRWEKATKELETATEEEAFSTFSMHVSDVSFKLAAAALLEGGTWPERDKIRAEEFVNAFDYGDPGVSLDEKVACRTEQAAHPFLQQRNLIRVSMRAAATGRSGGQPLRLTVLLDKSGSMEREDREAAVAKAMDALASHLTGDDVITVIGFARTPRLIADRMSGDRAGELAKLVAQAPSEGGTNLEEALQLGREVALRQHLDGGVNRIVLMTDGAANLGDARPEALSEMVVRLRNEGVAFDACGVGADGLNDEILEALTREGDGRYYFLNRAEDADEGFVKQLAGALRPAAKNVKVQVEFNPERVRGYRLLGFEKHRLEKEDFRNDSVDAAEMAAEEAGVAVYQTEVMPGGEGDVGKVWVRFQDVATGGMVERSWRIPYEARAPRLADAPAAMKLAGTAVLLGEKLKGEAGGELVDLAELAAIGAPLRQEFSGSQRVEQLIQMIEVARNLEQ